MFTIHTTFIHFEHALSGWKSPSFLSHVGRIAHISTSVVTLWPTKWKGVVHQQIQVVGTYTLLSALILMLVWQERHFGFPVDC